MMDMTDRSPENSAAGRRPHAIVLFSGGLDSALAVLLLLRQDVEVTALTFMTAFGCDLSDRSSCGHNPFPAAERFGFRVKLMNLGTDYIDMVRKPRFGYGKNMNPCVDCRIMMLRQAKDFMDLSGADFVATGEVLGQRPFSQVKHRLQLTEQEAGLSGVLLRPLSAKLLPVTVPEQRGWVDREGLMAFEGRSRKPQMELARELGLEDYPNPASGCLLTDPGYAARLRDLLRFSDVIDLTDLNLLRTGRQFRLSDRCKAVVGRNEQDNQRIVAACTAADVVLEVPETGSPITILRGAPEATDIELAAAITARYSARRAEPHVAVAVRRGNGEERLTVEPATPESCERLRVVADSPSDSAGHAPE
jgi:tRNA U34 2-thiouridine synthase MnmA/TrmU